MKDLNLEKNINFEKINSQIVYLFFAISSILLSIFIEPKLLYPDSQSYIIMSPARSPGYPFLFFKQFLFGEFFKLNYFFNFYFGFTHVIF